MSTLPRGSLASQLLAYEARVVGRTPAARLAVMETATAELKATGIETRAKKVGDLAPSLCLPDIRGNLVKIERHLEKGPVVLTFFRGAWSPYCSLTLRAWEEQLAELLRLDATLVAISAQTRDNSLSTAAMNGLSFPVLSDSELVAADSFGIAYSLPLELVNLYNSLGHSLPDLNGNGRWALPIPATFVIDPRGVIRFSHIDADYRNRAEPSEVVDLVRTLTVNPSTCCAES